MGNLMIAVKSMGNIFHHPERTKDFAEPGTDQKNRRFFGGVHWLRRESPPNEATEVHPRKRTNSSPKKGPPLDRKCMFQPLIVRGCSLAFRGEIKSDDHLIE